MARPLTEGGESCSPGGSPSRYLAALDQQLEVCDRTDEMIAKLAPPIKVGWRPAFGQHGPCHRCLRRRTPHFPRFADVLPWPGAYRALSPKNRARVVVGPGSTRHTRIDCSSRNRLQRLRSICNCPLARPLPYFPQIAERVGNERAQAPRDALRGSGTAASGTTLRCRTRCASTRAPI